jgi:hypothetical protein
MNKRVGWKIDVKERKKEMQTKRERPLRNGSWNKFVKDDDGITPALLDLSLTYLPTYLPTHHLLFES